MAEGLKQEEVVSYQEDYENRDAQLLEKLRNAVPADEQIFLKVRFITTRWRNNVNSGEAREVEIAREFSWPPREGMEKWKVLWRCWLLKRRWGTVADSPHSSNLRVRVKRESWRCVLVGRFQLAYRQFPLAILDPDEEAPKPEESVTETSTVEYPANRVFRFKKPNSAQISAVK